MLSRMERRRWRRFRLHVNWLWLLVFTLLLVMTTAAVEASKHSEALDGLREVARENRDLYRDYLCAVGYTALCPGGQRPWQ